MKSVILFYRHCKKWVNLKLLGISLLIFLSYLGYRYPLTFDATNLKNNTLTDSSKNLLSQLDKPLSMELVSPDLNIANQVRTTVALFQKENPKITLKVHQTALSPQEKKAFSLQTNHTLLLTYGERKKVFDLDMPQLNEPILANLIYQVLRNKEEWTVFLSGHGEQDPCGSENRHFGQLTTDLKKKGISIATINSGEVGGLPDNTKILVIADNQEPFLPKEMDHILQYLDKGGNLLWMANPDSKHGLEKLALALGIQWQNGTILDPKAHAMGTPHPAISVIMHYTAHPITRALEGFTVFPWSRPLDYTQAAKKGWEAQPFLTTPATTTLEQGDKKLLGPFTIGVTLQKDKQRVVVIGNSHFLSNSTIHNYGNLALANNIFNWLSETDVLLGPTTLKLAIDLAFTDTPFIHISREYLFPYLLPLVYLSIAWYTRRSRYQKSRFS
jgi:hypothetical protein